MMVDMEWQSHCKRLLGRRVERVTLHQPNGLEARGSGRMAQQTVWGDVVVELDSHRLSFGWQQRGDFSLSLTAHCLHGPAVASADDTEPWLSALGGAVRRVEATLATPFLDSQEILRDVSIVGSNDVVTLACCEWLPNGRVFWPTDKVTIFYGEAAFRAAELGPREPVRARTLTWG